MIRIVTIKKFRPTRDGGEFLLGIEGEKRELIWSFKKARTWAIIDDVCDAIGIPRPAPGTITPPNFFNKPMRAEIDLKTMHLKRFLPKLSS